MSKLSKFKIATVTLALAGALAVPIAIAQSTGPGAVGDKEHRHHRGGEGKQGAGLRGFRNLDLTDAQKAQLKQIREAHHQSLQPLMTEIRTKRQEIREANNSGTFDEALVSRKLTEIAPLEAKLMGERFRLRQEMLSILTAEQKTKLEQARGQFKSRRGGRRFHKQ